MKKRLISLLLTLVMLVSLCPALAATASADAQVTTVTLNSGDTVLKLCQNIGVDYYAHKNLIMSLNGFTSEAQFSKMGVGTKVVLPVSNAAAANLSKSGVGAATTTTTPVASTLTGTPSLVTGTTTSIPTGDYASYYLVNYTVQPGETISGIYNNWGLSYKTYANQIVKINRLGSINSIQANRTYVLPTTNPAIAGSAYTTVMAHVMRPGDSAYNIICTDYGLNYNSVQAQVQALNNRENLGNFMVGEVLYIPVTGLVSSNTTVTPGTGSSSSSAIINGSAAYNLVSQTPSNGNFALVVDGNVANAAVAGKTVEIVATPNAGYAVSSINVTKVGDPNSSVTVQGNKFIMPAYSVSVSVSFSQAVVSNIKVDATVNGSVSAMVNSAVVSSATAGSLVTVKTIPATGFMLDTIRVTYNDYRDTVAVENGQFVMPTFPVTVSASFKVDPNFDPTKGHNIYVDAANAKVVTMLGETSVSTAKAGDRVTLSITPDTNYTVQNLVVYYDNFNKTVDVEKNAFTMPDGPVTIVATVKPTASAVFGITKVVNKDGNVSVTVNGQEASSANVGATVKITGSSSKAYFNYVPTVFKTGDTSTTVPVAADGTFTMPDFPVTVSVKFYIYRNIYLDASNGTNGWFNVTAALNGMAISKAGAGVELKVTVWGFNEYTHAPGDVIITYADGSVHTFTGATFIMPDCDIKVRVNFNPVQRIAAYSAVSYKADGKTSAGRAYNSYTVGGLTVDDNGSYLKATLAGEKNTVIVSPSPALGFRLNDIRYSYYDANGVHHANVPVNYNSSTGRYQFEMPRLKSGTSLELRVSFIEIKSYNINLDYNASLGNVTATTSIGVVTSAAGNSKVTLIFAPKSGYTVDYSTISVTDASGAAVRFNKNDNSFFMPDSNVTVKVNFKTDLNTVYVTPSDNTLDNTAQKGMISVLVNGAKYTESQFSYSQSLGKFYIPSTVKAGSIVTVINESSTGYVLDSETPITVKSSDASIPVEMVDRDKFTFVMPNADVTITPVYTEDLYNISTVATDKGTLNLPKQASYIDTLSIAADTIVAKPGYELDKLLVTYTDHKGIQHRDEEVDLAVGFKPVGEGIPKSEVVFEAVFKPALNPITINYIYNSAPSNRNFAIDLYLDSKLVEGIQRDPNGSMDVLAIDTANNYGLPTGATVRIARQTENQDANFSIKNMWIMHNGNAIEPKYENNQYFFTVPFVDSKLPADLVLNVQYGTENDEGFRLNVTEVEGTTTAINVNGRPATMAQPNDNIALSFSTPAGQEVTQVVFKYKNTSGDEITKEYAVDNNRFDTWSCPEHPITSLPKDGIVTISYTVSAAAHKVAYDDVNGGTAQFIVDNVAILEDADVAVGKVVTVQINAIGMAAKSIEAKCGETTLPVTATEDGKFQFTMPDGNVVVKAYFESTSYVLNTEFVGDGSGNVVYKVGETEYANGSTIPAGSSVSIIATPDAGSYVSAVSSNVTSADGKYSIEMPNTDTTITVTFTKVANGVSYETAHCEVYDGTTYVYPNTPIAYGNLVTVKLKDLSGKTVSAVSVKSGESDVPVTPNADGTYSFSMPLGVASITVSHVNTSYALTKEFIGSGTGSLDFVVNGAPIDGSAVPHGTDITAVVTPAVGSKLDDHIKVNGNYVSKDANGNYPFKMPNGNATVTVNFGVASNGISYKSAHCSVLVGGGPVGTDTPVAYGTEVLVKPIVSNSNQTVSAVTVKCGESDVPVIKNSDGSWSFSMPEGVAVVTVNYDTLTFTLTSRNNNNGSGTIKYKVGETEYADGSKIPAGSIVNIIATPDENSSFQGAWLGTDLTDADADGNLDFAMPAADSELIVNFMSDTYKLENISTGSDATLKFYKTEERKAADEITSGASVACGSTVYAEIVVNRCDKTVAGIEVTWNDGTNDQEENPTVYFDKVVDYKSAAYKFDFEMPAADTEVDFNLVNETKVSLAYDSSRASVVTPVPIGSNFTVTVLPDALGRAIYDVYLEYSDAGGAKAPRCVASVGNEFTFNIPDAPIHVGNNLNLVKLVVKYVGE